VATNQEYRHAIRHAFQAYAQQEGGLRSHMANALTQYVLAGRPGISPQQQLVSFNMVHSALVNLITADPYDQVLHAVDSLIHQAVDALTEEFNLSSGEKSRGIDPLVTAHADDFEAWANELPDVEQIVSDMKKESDGGSES
jgi:uncharacterized lipoprotein YmbA